MVSRVYAYAIIDSNERIDKAIKGLGGSQVFNIPYHDIGVAASHLNGEIQDIAPRAKDFGMGSNKDYVLEHEKVVEKLMEKFTALPIRFFTIFNKKEDVFSMTKNYYNDFRRNLDRLHGKVEFGIKVIWPGDKTKERIINACGRENQKVPVLGDSPGKRFIKEKFEEYKIDKKFKEEANRYIRIVDDFFSKFAAEKKLEKLKSTNLLLNASYLVEREKQDSFKKAFEQFRREHCDLKYLFSGPWPAYNFVTLKKKAQQWTK